MRIKKIAERRTIWGGGRRRRKSAETAAERLLEEIDANQDADDGSELC